MRKIKKFKKHLLFIGLIILSVVPLFDFFHSGLPLTHDGQDHVARIANFYQNLSEGNIIPRWAGNLNWGYGHPILEFLYPLSSYFASFFHFFGFTLIDSVKLVFGISYILSGLTMYFFIKELLNNNKAAFLASALYIIAPYRFVDLYVRGAIGEHVAFMFPPLIFYFLLKLSKRYSLAYLISGAFSFAGLILSHNAVTLMFLPLICIYIFYLIFKCFNKKYFMLSSFILILLSFGLSAFFWIPAFMEGKYTLRDIVTRGGEYAASFVMLKDLFYGQWSYGGTLSFSKQVGVIHWIGIFTSVISIFYLYKRKNKLWILSLGSFIILGITLFLTMLESNLIWQVSTILQKFQFPWRFLSLAVFLSALLSAIAFHVFSDKRKKVLLLILVIGLFVVNKDYWRANGYLNKSESFYTNIYDGTTDTGESAPVWSVRFMEKRSNANIEVILGKARVEEISRSFTSHSYKIVAKDRIRIKENTLYFPGWRVYVDGKKTDVEFQDQKNRGLITFFLEKGDHKVDIKFGETKLRLVADTITFMSLFSVVILVILKNTKRWKRFP